MSPAVAFVQAHFSPTMNRFVVIAMVATSWVQAQTIYLPDPAPGTRTDTPQARDGVFLVDSAVGVRATLEGRDVLVRFPVVRTTAPKARGIFLVDTSPNSQLVETPTGFALSNREPTSTSEYLIHVICDKAPVEEPERMVVVLGTEVFWDVRVKQSRGFRETRWLSWPVEKGEKATQCLRDAARVFGAAEKQVLDLRLGEAQRALPAKVAGPVTEKEVEEIRQTVFAMARREILEYLAERPHEAWPDLLRSWPGRPPVQIISTDGRYAAVYYAPNAGYQFEKIGGKWTIVGG